ncbi:MAG: hypothetical protein MUC95_04550 [Spirochaetes bacterium]|nr:hypothetical protein [Spirochaetota bacterium]
MRVNIIYIIIFLLLSVTAQASREYFKQYPRGHLVADARLIIADREKKPAEAIKQYRTIVDTYRYFKKRDYAQYRICQLQYLLSDWKSLMNESAKGLKLFKESVYRANFRLFIVRADIQMGDYETARDICAGIIKENQKGETHSESLLLMSLINKKMYGFSRGYISFLHEYIINYKDSGKMPAAIFMLGNYYEATKDYNRAFSAYSDIISKYPKSLESVYASQNIEALEKFNPVKFEYLPGEDTIKHTDDIDIQPEMDMDNGENAEADIIYSISVGPLNSLEGAENLRKVLTGDFDPIKIVEVSRNSFMLYAGKYATVDSAVAMRTRLAEEYEINGLIVKMIKNDKRIYIFEE